MLTEHHPIPTRSDLPRHVAIIMDGNGRWATQRRLPREIGHLMGAKTVLRVSDAAADLGIPYLTLFAFSSDNWKRPTPEVTSIMTLIEKYLRLQALRAVARGTRVCIIGRRDRIPEHLRRTIGLIERTTMHGNRLRLRIAVDYSARESMLSALGKLDRAVPLDSAVFRTALARELGEGEVAPDVDLMIRTGGEQRLSDFLLWESAYAELLFLNKMWPDFDADDFVTAVEKFQVRDRRFGYVAPPIGAEIGGNESVGRNRHRPGGRPAIAR